MHQSLPQIRAFAFDYDDTLVQTRECRFGAIKELALRFYSHSLTDTDIEYHWGKPFETLFRELFSSLDQDHTRVVERYISLRGEFPITAHPGAVEALHSLCSNFAVSIVTSASRSVVLQDVEALGFPVDRMIAIQCAEDTEHHKPDPLVFTPLKEKLAKRGITPEQVMYIGDSTSDYFAARDAGFAFTGFNPFNSRINAFSQFQVPIVSDLRLLALDHKMAKN